MFQKEARQIDPSVPHNTIPSQNIHGWTTNDQMASVSEQTLLN